MFIEEEIMITKNTYWLKNSIAIKGTKYKCNNVKESLKNY